MIREEPLANTQNRTAIVNSALLQPAWENWACTRGAARDMSGTTRNTIHVVLLARFQVIGIVRRECVSPARSFVHTLQ